ncbi:N-acetylmuramoyl-L-alanine amidase [Enterococcus sp. LJL120]
MAVSPLATKFKFENFGATRWGSRGNTKVDTIVVHHMATTNFDSVPGVWATRKASAHYGIGPTGEIRAYVDETKRAWHAGNENSRSIGIECCNTSGAPNWLVSDATVTALVALIQDIKKRYNITRIIGHRDGVGAATACPGPSLYPRLQEIRNRVAGQTVAPPASSNSNSSIEYNIKAWNKQQVVDVNGLQVRVSPTSKSESIDSLNKGFTFNATRMVSNGETVEGYSSWFEVNGRGWVSGAYVTPTNQNSTSSVEQIAVDGYWGAATTRRIQQVLKIAVDGIKGPETYKAIQRKVGTPADGIIGPNTIRAMQKYFGTVQDGVISEPSLMVKAMQTRLNQNKF